MMNKYQTQLGKFWAKDLGPFRENGLDQDSVPTSDNEIVMKN